MLLRDEVEIRRSRPAELALIGARAPPGLAGTEVVGPLPAVLRAEDRAQLLEAPVQRAEPLRPPPLVRVERITKAVVVAVDLTRGGGREVGVAVRAAEAPGPVALDVELRLAGRDELRSGLPHSAGSAEAVQREAGRHPESRDPRHRAEERVAVGRHRVGMADELHHARVVQEGEAADRALPERPEALLVRRKRPAPVLPRNAVLPARDGVALVAAEEHSTGFAAPVDQVVGVAEAGHLARKLVAVHRG